MVALCRIVHTLTSYTLQPRQQYIPPTALPKPQSYFVLALVATVCCCNLIGAVGVVYSLLVSIFC